MDVRKTIISDKDGFLIYKLVFPNLTLYVLEHDGIRYIRRNRKSIDAIIQKMKTR